MSLEYIINGISNLLPLYLYSKNVGYKKRKKLNKIDWKRYNIKRIKLRNQTHERN